MVVPTLGSFDSSGVIGTWFPELDLTFSIDL
jgi:hypothetical protein